jgi:hypothetical protein
MVGTFLYLQIICHPELASIYPPLNLRALWQQSFIIPDKKKAMTL